MRLPTAIEQHAIESWMDGQGLGSGPLREVSALTGGTQNLMWRFRRGPEEFVLRRGPEHLRTTSNRTIEREVRLLDALAATSVPHPRLLAACADPRVLGDAAFYLMEAVPGFNPSVTLPAEYARDAGWRHDLGLAMAQALADLARVDVAAVGLDGFGRPEGFLGRQVPRWLAELGDQSELGYSTPSRGELLELARWLEDRLPPSSRPGLMHGDFHFANVLADARRPQLSAVIDWEMATVGDPLLDLGGFIALGPSAAGKPDLIGSAISAAGGLAAEEELVEHYRTVTGWPLHDLDCSEAPRRRRRWIRARPGSALAPVEPEQ
jgi:aminoglycoside phosphotransferase (APT) family kinase protein